MSDLFLGLSPEYLYYKNKPVVPVRSIHQPYFVAFAPSSHNTASARSRLHSQWKKNPDHPQFSKIADIGQVETYRSFSSYQHTRDIFPVYTKESYVVPEISDFLFFEYGLYTAEHDIPYQQRALTDLAAQEKLWLFDSKGRKETLKVLVYDIETTQFEEGKQEVPIDIIGYSPFSITFSSSKQLDQEEFQFDIHDCPTDWSDLDITQVMAQNEEEELQHLLDFCTISQDFDIISGHNILGFDNAQLQSRVQWMMKQHSQSLSDNEKKVFDDFLTLHCRRDTSFHFGVGNEVVQWHPCSFDTYLATRKFYSFLDEFSLKAVAPFLGIEVKDRVYLTPSQIKLDERTLKYNKHDVQEQLGVTLHLLQQALPLAFTMCMPFDMLLPAGAVNMWDHMAMIRAKLGKKLMPPICRVKSITDVLSRDFSQCSSKEDIVNEAKQKREQLSKDFIRVVKYGEEMPDWVQFPYVISNQQRSDDEPLGYHMPGGMTIKPDKEADSHFVPWYNVVVADVGAMYPTILKAMNVGADTVRLATKNETPDEWVWLKRLPKNLFDKIDINWREVSDNEAYADKGVLLGIMIDPQPGVVNQAMTGILNMIARVKQELKEAREKGNAEEIQRLAMMYQSMKGARNAGSVDYQQRIILQTPNGDLKNISIGEFVDNAIKKYGMHVKTIQGTEFEIADIPDSWKAYSVNIKGNVELKRVTQAVRHKWNGDMVKITTKSGFTVVTPNHSIFTINNDKIKEIEAGSLGKDTVIAHVKKIPAIEKKYIINLIQEISQPGFFAFIDKKDLKYFNGFKQTLLSMKEKDSKAIPYVKISIEKIKDMTIPEELLQYVTVGSNGRKASRISSLIPVDERLAELLGYYISEGHISTKYVRGNPQYYITISCSDKQIHERIHKLSYELFGSDVYTLDRMKDTHTIVSTMHPKILNYLLENIFDCGIRSREKQIPYQILSSSFQVKDAFLKAYMDGDGNIKSSMPSSVPLGRYTTNSQSLNEDLITLQKQYGIKTNTYFRSSDQTYNTRMINYFKGEKASLEDCYAIPPKQIEYMDPTSDYVYDISVEDNENFIDANGGIILHNTHGILAAPTVTGRQFNLWGAAAITTKGQAILHDTLQYLDKKGVRVVYGDTDGIYLGCSRSMGNVPLLAKNLGVNTQADEAAWLTKPDTAIQAIEECNQRWRKELSYEEFELEPEDHDAMLFVKHKNYLIFDAYDDAVEMITKGNNFKGSDKANIARRVLETIMMQVLRDNPVWEDEAKAREEVRQSIKNITREILATLDLSKVSLYELTLVQSVQPSKRYKTNMDGSMSTFGKRAQALEKVIGDRIHSRVKMKFVVTKHALPGLQNPSKSGVKPIDYMYPIDYLKNKDDIDLKWYKEMIENYIKGAFGLSDIASTEQKGLDAWM